MPVRLKRRRGLLPNSAFFVGNGTKYENPYKVGRNPDVVDAPIYTALEAVNEYKYWWRLLVQEKEWDLEELRGKDLVCTCPLEDEDGNPYPCHADFLLELMG